MNQMKVIIFDASTIISLAMNGLFEEVKKLKSIFNGKFLITEGVREEVIDTPLKIRRFQFQALRIKQLLDDEVFELPACMGITNEDIIERSLEFLETANSLFIEGEKEVHLIDKGEASCLALGRILDEEGIENVLAVDERTTRMLIEKPENLKKLMENKLHTKLKTRKGNFSLFRGFKIIRSVELAYIAYKKGLIQIKGEEVLAAMLYGLKLNGASVSEYEINDIKNS